MKNINLEKFELGQDALSKILGGIIMNTGGQYLADTDQWCEGDAGEPGEDPFVFFECCWMVRKLNKGGLIPLFII